MSHTFKLNVMHKTLQNIHITQVSTLSNIRLFSRMARKLRASLQFIFRGFHRSTRLYISVPKGQLVSKFIRFENFLELR